MNHHLRRLVSLKHCLVFSEACVILSSYSRVHAPFSRRSGRAWEWYCQVVWWMWCCGSCGSGCVSNKSIVSILTSNQQFHKKTRLTAQQPPLISHTTTRRWLRVHDSLSKTCGGTPTMYATTSAAAEKRPRSSTPAPAAQRVSEHRGQDKQLPARSEAAPK